MTAITVLILLFILLILVLAARTVAYRRAYRKTEYGEYKPSTISEKALNRFSSFIQLKTVTYNDFKAIDMDEHLKVESFFKDNFPLAGKKLDMKKLNDFAYIFRWEGKNTEAKPVLLMAHFDVVPAQDGKWINPPFSGNISDGYIWGRGTLDTKSSLMGILEAAEKLLAEEFIPETTIYFAFGGDEEIMGLNGAVEIVKYFKEQNTSFSWILDEGSVITKNMLKMVKEPLALIGIAEKGFANVLLRANNTPGHASMPPEHTATGLVARAVYRMERHPFPSHLTLTVRNFLKALIPHVSFPLALVFSNLWLFGPLVKHIFKKSPTTAAMVRTTQAATVINGSDKDNILPDKAEAIVNVRILPGQTKGDVLKRIREVVNDVNVDVSYTHERDVSDPVAESDVTAAGYGKIEKTIHHVYPEAVTAPFLVTATTDSRHYREIADDIYRFVPLILTGDDLKKIHGFNESIPVENYALVIKFFTELIKSI